MKWKEEEGSVAERYAAQISENQYDLMDTWSRGRATRSM
jgi:hypothetical protein